MFYRQYYSELGKLLYAIANSSGAVSEKEKQKLKDIVRKELVPAEKHNDKFGTDAAYYAEIEFDILEDSVPDIESAFDSFLFFIENHHTAIDNRMRQAALKISKEMANIYLRKNKKEKDFLNKLRRKLEALPAQLR